MTTLQKFIQRQIDQLESTVVQGLIELQKDFVRNLSWYAEVTWKSEYQAKFLKAIIQDLNENTDEKMVIAHHTKWLHTFQSKSYNVREKGGNAVATEVSIWKYESHFELLQTMEYLVAAIEEVNPTPKTK